jgi:hypothetical protein
LLICCGLLICVMNAFLALGRNKNLNEMLVSTTLCLQFLLLILEIHLLVKFLLVQYLKGESCSLVHCGSVVGAIFRVYELND